MKSNRLLPLEALRGLAAIIVVIHHFFLGFSPLTTGSLSELRDERSIIGHWYFLFFNGSAAVIFFFTLSGVVLCSKYLNSKDNKDLFSAFLKRWPRLAFPVLVTSVISYFLFKFNLYFFQDASLISKSTWLATFANSGWTVDFHPNFARVVYEALTTFFNGHSHYNSNLWTMKPEFIGSNFVFLLALVYTFFSYQIFLIILLLIVLLAFCFYPVIFSFAAGFFLATNIKKNKYNRFIWTKFLSFALVLIGFYLLGYSIPEKDYLWLIAFKKFKSLSILIHTLGSLFLIYGVMINGSIYNHMNGKVSNFLGQISFSLYLIHILFISSFSSYLYIKLYQLGFGNLPVLTFTLLFTLLGSILASAPIIYLDRLWVNYINRFFVSVIRCF